MDSPAAIPPAWLRHSKHLQLNQPTLTAVINAGILVVLSCRWAGPRPRLDTRGHGWAIACLTTLYDIALHWPTISWYNFFSRYEPYCRVWVTSALQRCALKSQLVIDCPDQSEQICWCNSIRRLIANSICIGVGSAYWICNYTVIHNYRTPLLKLV